MVTAGDHLVEDLKTKSDLAHDNEKIEGIYYLSRLPRSGWLKL